jgi:hypothetical protein
MFLSATQIIHNQMRFDGMIELKSYLFLVHSITLSVGARIAQSV